MSTATEDAIKQLKRSRRSKAILVPRIEEFMTRPVEVEDEADKQFMANLIEARSRARKKGVYSPSMLVECIRKVYFIKTGEVKAHPIHRVSSNGIFLDGNFRHFKWQFAIWKMHRAGIIKLLDVGSVCLGSEIYVENEKGDFGGTLDTLIHIPDLDVICTVDWKGMNGNNFASAAYSGPGIRYINQSVGYALLANSVLDLPKPIKKVLIIGENKNGAIYNRRVKTPLGLLEWDFDVDDYKFAISKRIKTLRAFEKRKETPPAECVSTHRQMFKECPFAPYCRGEVEAYEQKKKRKAKKKIRFDNKR